MNFEKRFRQTTAVEGLLLAFLIAAVLFLGPELASGYHLYELLGVLPAAMITTFGIWKMIELT